MRNEAGGPGISALSQELDRLGANSWQRAVFEESGQRGLDALQLATRREVRSPLNYAITLLQDPTWRATRTSVRTNVHATSNCAHCHGDHVVLVNANYNPLEPYAEVYTPCTHCT